jgi:hypothetical protein
MKFQSISEPYAAGRTGADEAGLMEIAPSALQVVNGGLGTVAGGPGSIYTTPPSNPVQGTDQVVFHQSGPSCPGYR